MNEVKLSKRLEAVAAELLTGSKMADIGSDHAYLPCYAVLRKIVKGAVAGEVVEGPYQSALAKVRECGLTDIISVRKGNGLAVIEPGEVDVITIAGMGGALIRDILDNGKEKLVGVKRLILQPNIGAHNIRKWLVEHDWELIKEIILKEDGKIYEILVAERGDGNAPYTTFREHGMLLGPFLLQEKSDVFVEKWMHEKQNLSRIFHQLEQAADTEENQKKKQEVLQKIALIEEVL
ncbi:tRNA (adenine(22)-N(1))-methyltransferase TrmK [Ectobacillus antri]|jgi:tRNA (adenine22-N1)-methyltransferase|uniref:tRNA (Adenine(22)-N(1))-methyltransferase TrmK n=1 Tax=Ectobacillus antri TaxID=2486280 RepID=A0ABT6H3B0_9BACI|nr:tRNA (adenine(22)-N(1))-methyltransferase TrmK [Ectobacillus antri]MDG4655505.1 tRNA (adenine(22)-N(1))-methyltransferase TrmK [Ectobacillus antri]MDG5753263.1 tRNA (adenine(22)-N(1))-methyltransferase TrmK [Ectobacillus antri]